MMETLRVGYLSDVDPRDRWAWSGTHHHMLAALGRQGLEVVPIVANARAGRLRRLLARATGRGGTPNTAAAAADWVPRRLQENRVDVVFAPVASSLVPHVPAGIPVAYLSDATFGLLRSSYPEVAALPAAEAEPRDAAESAAIRRADCVVYPSEWAARSAIDDYGAAPDKVRIIPLGANLDHVPAIHDDRSRPAAGVLELLFIGRDWQRKGGDIALRTLDLLRQRGIPARLTVCGTTPPAGSDTRDVRVIASLDKRRWADRRRLAKLLQQAHFLLFPSRAECFGVVCAEANAYGVPVIAANVGGIPIVDGLNGRRVDLERGAEGFVAPIAAIWGYPAAYNVLRASSRSVYDRDLNWDAWGARVHLELARLATVAHEGIRA